MRARSRCLLISSPGAVAVVVAYGGVDAAVHVRRLLEVARPLHGEAAPLVDHRGEHLDERGQHRVVRGQRRSRGGSGRRGRRKGCGSCRDANIPAISSDMVARLSPVARSAARPAAATSSTRRASNMSSRVNPWRAAIRLRGPVDSFGGPAVMKLPAPWRDSTTPTAASERRPARTEGRLTLIWRASSRSAGRRSPGLSCPVWMSFSMCMTTRSAASGSSRRRSGAGACVRTSYWSYLMGTAGFESARMIGPRIRSVNRKHSALGR